MAWLAPEASADAHCFCSLACEDNTNYRGGTVKGQIWDAGPLATYKGPLQQGDKNQTACNTLCGIHIANKWPGQTAAALACSHGCANGARVSGWSKVGTREWKFAQTVGVLTNTPAAQTTTCTCPQGTKNAQWVDGGTVPVGGKCTYVACDGYKPFPGSSYPANGTLIGTWGYTWGHFIGQAIAPTCVTNQTAPAICTLLP